MKTLITLALLMVILSGCSNLYCAAYGSNNGYHKKDRR